MASRNLDREHPDYIATKDSRTRSRVLHGGSRVFKEVDSNGLTYLLKGTNESDDDYAYRLKRSVLDNYIEKIVQARQGLLFRKEHARNLPTKIELYAGDVDRDGTPADVFFQEVARDAQIDGIHWVLADMPRAPQGGFRSLREERQAGQRPYFKQVSGANVIDWQEDELGELLWAVIRESHLKPRAEPGTDPEQVSRWRILYRDRWELLEARQQGAGSGLPYAVIEQGPNPLGRVPLVPFFGFQRTSYSGWPVCVSVLDHIILLLNKNSELDRAERRKTEPIPYFVCPEKPVRIDSAKGLWIDSSGVQGQIQVGLLEPNAAGLEHNLNSIAGLRETIFSIALAQAKKDTAQVQSADSQREDRYSFTSALKSVSRSYEDQETKCWRLWAAWAGVPWGEEHEIEYNREFDQEELDADMIRVLSGLADSNRLTSRTLLDMLQRAERLPRSIDIEDELKELEREKVKSVELFRESFRGQRPPEAPGDQAA